MTIAQLARRPTPESPWESVEQDREEYHRQREVALRAYEQALEKPEAQTALAVRAAASAATSQEIGDIAQRWAAEHASGQVVAHVPAEDQARFIFTVQAVRELAAERQKRLARRLGDVVALGDGALKSTDIEDIRAALTDRGYPIRRVRDAIFAVRVYRNSTTEPAEAPLRVVNLFAGIDAASHAATLIGDGKRFEVVAVAEVQPYPIAVMARHYPQVPNLGDVEKVDWAAFRATHGEIDLVTAGFPCQNLSRAGDGKGLKGKKSILFFEVIRAIEVLQPKYLILENVEGIFDRPKRGDLLTVIRRCRKAGYVLDIAGLEATDYGLPMLRSRFYAVGVRRDLARMLPKRRAWRYHDVAPQGAERMLAELRRNPAEPLTSLKAWEITQYSSIDGTLLDGREVAGLDRPTGEDKGFARRLGIDLDARRDIGKALAEARKMRPPTPEEVEAYRKAWIAANPAKVAQGEAPPKDKDIPWIEIRRPRFSLLGGLVSAHHVPQPSWLGDVLDRTPSADLLFDYDGLRVARKKWRELTPDREAYFEMEAFTAPRRRWGRNKNRRPGPIDVSGIQHPIAHGISHTLWQEGKSYSLGGLGIRPHSCYNLTTHCGWGVVQEGRARLISHDELDLLMGFPRGYSHASEVLNAKGKPRAPSKDARYKALGNSMAVPCIQAALEGCLIAELCLRGM